MVPTSPIPNLVVRNSTLDALPAANFDAAESPAFALRRELSLWLSAIPKFIEPENYSFKDADSKNVVRQNWSNEMRVLRFSLMRAAFLTSQFEAKSKTLEFEASSADFETKDFAELYLILSRFSIVCDRLLSVHPLDYYGWSTFCSSLKNNLENASLSRKMISADSVKLPESLERLNQTAKVRYPFGKEVLGTIARLNGLLEILRIVGSKLQNDSPLKNSLLFFSLIHSETKDLISFIEQRLLRRMPPENEFFDLLDGTIYIMSLELKKVYSRELKGVLDLRPAPQVVARVETSYGLLQDCFQQSIILLAEAFDPEIEGWQIFPNYQTRLEESLVLRQDLWNALQHVQLAEKSPDTFSAEKLKKSLEHLRDSSLHFLMFKDCEPTERFIEEILQTKRLQDITHVLHRFGAYLETLLGQVSMRGVLTNHPFDYPKIED
ncbi:MAG: hypothetical protein M3209_11750 [Acidobacteriota bacterium]|nr:hypothetical protein [Acidobacteriota bacterium]